MVYSNKNVHTNQSEMLNLNLKYSICVHPHQDIIMKWAIL